MATYALSSIQRALRAEPEGLALLAGAPALTARSRLLPAPLALPAPYGLPAAALLLLNQQVPNPQRRYSLPAAVWRLLLHSTATAAATPLPSSGQLFPRSF